MSEMPPEIRIEIEKIGDKQYRSRVLTGEGQEIVTNDFSYDPELLYNIEAQKYLETDVIRQDEEVKSDFLPLYGQKLYRYLFGDGSAFSNFLKFKSSVHVRINLCLHPEAAPLWSVPWEYIHDGKEALAINGRYLISRIPWGIREIPVPKTPLPPPLRILVLISSPDDQPELNTEREIEAIQDALDDAQVKGIVKVDFLEEATLENIRDDKSFYIVIEILLLDRLKLKMVTNILGDENAAKDHLLNDCYVEPSEVSDRAILKGRWGVGKSAILLHKNQKLAEELAKNCEADKLLWYIGENAVDIYSLRHFQRALLEYEEEFKRILEALWETRILCTESLLLYKLREYYGSSTGKHWDYIAKIGEANTSNFPIGERIPDICMIFGLDKMGKENWYQTILHPDQRDIRKNILNYLQACLKDIQEEKLQPIIVIEPIDTPHSEIEKEGLAQILITALMNVYDSTFAPSENQRIPVRISVPWHRYKPQSFDFPQRFYPYVGHIKWNSKTLRNFINRRIEWEFKRVRRSVKGDSDAWSTLFENSITNDNFKPRISEDSFFFLLRHTHHRPRDIQRLTRRIVENASSSNKTVDEVLSDRSTKISSSVFRKTIIETCHQLMRDEFIVEMRRKYSNIDESLDLVRGLSIPFSENNLVSRYRKKTGEKMSPDKLTEVASQLWESGIIGVEIEPKSEKIASLYSVLPTEGYRKYLVGEKNIHRWYFFEYNYDGDPIELRRGYERCVEDSEAGFILHPATFEYLQPSINAKCPIGV